MRPRIEPPHEFALSGGAVAVRSLAARSSARWPSACVSEFSEWSPTSASGGAICVSPCGAALFNVPLAMSCHCEMRVAESIACVPHSSSAPSSGCGPWRWCLGGTSCGGARLRPCPCSRCNREYVAVVGAPCPACRPVGISGRRQCGEGVRPVVVHHALRAGRLAPPARETVVKSPPPSRRP